MTHGSIGRFDNKGLLLALPAQLLDVVLELGVLSGEDPCLGYEAVLLRLALDHSGDKEWVGMCAEDIPGACCSQMRQFTLHDFSLVIAIKGDTSQVSPSIKGFINDNLRAQLTTSHRKISKIARE